MIKITRILAATDFSECSNHALRYACEFAEVFGAELHVVNVIEISAAAYPEFGMGIQDVEAGLRRAAETDLNALPGEQWQNKFSVVRAVATGAAFVEIVRYARDQAIDLIVVGTHGRGAIAHMLMGSTAEKIVRKAPCPVLTVRPETHEFVMP